MLRHLQALSLSALLIAGPTAAFAHCDSADGPVAHAVAKALQTGNIYLVLPYAPAEAEPELKASFAQARKVRTLGGDALALADRSFLETTIRLHRAGEGAPFTGVKPGGTDFGPMIPAAERAVETGNLEPMKALLRGDIDHALGERLTHVRDVQKASLEPTSDAGVEAARERISAELAFVTYAEAVRQAVLGKLPAHHEE